MADSVNYLEMSDEDLLKAPVPSFEAPAAGEQDANGKPAQDAGAVEDPAAGEQRAENTDPTALGDESADDAADRDRDDKGRFKTKAAGGAAAEGDDEPAGDSPAGEEAADAKGVDAKNTEEKKGEEKAKAEGEKTPAKAAGQENAADQVDYKAQYERLLAPFKANGRDIQVQSVDDAIALMQMGANYNKKMEALKPNLKLMKMLDHNGLLSEEKIGFLIDLGKKNPGAINKLIKEAGIDPMDLDAEKAGAYKQSAYAVDDREIELDTILDELQGSPSYTRTLEVVSNKWDLASKQAVSQSPQLLKVIHDHVASGIYDLISTEIERERVFGRLKGMSDIEAYRQVGDNINARGGFAHLVNKPSGDQGKAKTPPPVVVPQKPKQADDAKLNDKRRAASSTKPAAPTGKPADFNPLNLSDEEFAKLTTPKFN